VVFDKSPTKTYMQLRFRSQLQKRDEDRELMRKACQTMEVLVMQVFAKYGWRFSNRIGLS
jgi:hypothetical protein